MSRSQPNKIEGLTPIADYIEQKKILTQTPGVIKNGKMYVKYRGHLILDSKFRAEFKLPDRLFSCKENPCKKVANLI
jgi:hypothetical protein